MKIYLGRKETNRKEGWNKEGILGKPSHLFLS